MRRPNGAKDDCAISPPPAKWKSGFDFDGQVAVMNVFESYCGLGVDAYFSDMLRRRWDGECEAAREPDRGNGS